MSRVIRRESLSPAACWSLADVERQALEMLEEARHRATRIEQEARHRADALIRSAHDRGYAQGLEQGRREGLDQVRREARQSAMQEAREEIARLASALRQALTCLEDEKRAILAGAESGLIRLALAIAERVCKTQAARSSDSALANARQLLELAAHHGDVTVRFHPEQLEDLRKCAADALEGLAGARHVTLAADASVAPGGCILHMTDGCVDATIETQIRRIAEALLTPQS